MARKCMALKLRINLYKFAPSCILRRNTNARMIEFETAMPADMMMMHRGWWVSVALQGEAETSIEFLAIENGGGGSGGGRTVSRGCEMWQGCETGIVIIVGSDEDVGGENGLDGHDPPCQKWGMHAGGR